MSREKRIVFFIIIAERKKRDALVSLMIDHGGQLINMFYARGSVKAGWVESALGLVAEENKIIASCLLPRDKSDALIATLNQKLEFEKPNTGIAFTIPIEGLYY